MRCADPEATEAEAWLWSLRPTLARFLASVPAPEPNSVLVAVDEQLATWPPGLSESIYPPGVALAWQPPEVAAAMADICHRHYSSETLATVGRLLAEPSPGARLLLANHGGTLALRALAPCAGGEPPSLRPLAEHGPAGDLVNAHGFLRWAFELPIDSISDPTMRPAVTRYQERARAAQQAAAVQGRDAAAVDVIASVVDVARLAGLMRAGKISPATVAPLLLGASPS